jgi:hypothetical protein
VLSIERISAEDRAKIEAVDPGIHRPTLAGSPEILGKRCPRHLDSLNTLVFGQLVLFVADRREV